MSEICCNLCKYWLSELKEYGNIYVDKCVNKEHFVKSERNCGICEREIYNEALEDFAEKMNKMLADTNLRQNGYYIENLVSIARSELMK